MRTEVERMKKDYRQSSFWIFVLLFTLGGWFIQYEIHKRESQFMQETSSVDSQFIAGGNSNHSMG